MNFEDFRLKVEPFDDETYNQFNNDVFKFWRYIEEDYRELASVALKLFSICVNAASVERMWSSMASINFLSRKKDLLQYENQFINSSKPIESRSSAFQNVDCESDDITIIEELNVQDSAISSDIDEEKEALRDNLGSLESDLLSDYKHPAVDPRAKWELKNLFNSLLDVPDYLINI
ncbi:6980_t:CDS:2 [Entrophospora sp. SA101]|nr:6980_t:CDS:2 [Entrophospora sp. SA101]